MVADELWFFSATQALEGKDIKDLLVNVGSGGGAAAAAGGAAAGGAAAAADAPAEEEKEEGASWPLYGPPFLVDNEIVLTHCCREGGVRRGYGFRSFRLNSQHYLLRRLFSLLLLCTSTAGHFGVFLHIDGCIQDGVGAYILRPGQSSFVHKDNMMNALTRRSSRAEGTNGQLNDSGRNKKKFFDHFFESFSHKNRLLTVR
jgi:hypothetical protein